MTDEFRILEHSDGWFTAERRVIRWLPFWVKVCHYVTHSFGDQWREMRCRSAASVAYHIAEIVRGEHEAATPPRIVQHFTVGK